MLPIFHAGSGGCKKTRDEGGVGRDVLTGRRRAWGFAGFQQVATGRRLDFSFFESK